MSDARGQMPEVRYQKTAFVPLRPLVASKGFSMRKQTSYFTTAGTLSLPLFAGSFVFVGSG